LTLLTLSHDFSQQVGVLEVVREGIGHGVVLRFVVDIEVVAAFPEHLSSSHHPGLLPLGRAGSF
jgi:hypothetical protein